MESRSSTTLDNTSSLFESDQSTSGKYVISPVFSDRSKLGMRIRLVLMTRIPQGGSPGQQGTLTIAAALRFFCG